MTEFNYWAARLPGTYYAQKTSLGTGGEAHMVSGRVNIDPAMVECRYLEGLMLHESMHVRQGQIYGDQQSAARALGPYGGIEVNADCAARYAGASHGSGYTEGPCSGKYAEAGKLTATGRAVA